MTNDDTHKETPVTIDTDKAAEAAWKAHYYTDNAISSWDTLDESYKDVWRRIASAVIETEHTRIALVLRDAKLPVNTTTTVSGSILAWNNAIDRAIYLVREG